MDVWVVTWQLPYEDGGFASVWSTEALAEAAASRLQSADRIGCEFDVERVEVDPEVDAPHR